VQEGLLDLLFNETINCEKYVKVILWQFFSELPEEERLYGWFQQDSATAHTARISMQALSDVFRDRLSAVVFGQHVHMILILVIFFFRSCSKYKVYNSWEIAIIPAEQLQRVNQNLFCQCEEGLRVQG
jgi:hypothetical protein